MRLLPCVAFLFTASFVAAAEDFKLEPGYKLIFNGKNLDGWQTKASKDGKSDSLEGKTEAFDGRFKVKDGEMVIDFKVKGDKYIETTTPQSGDFTIRFDFNPAEGCNNDLYIFGTAKFDIKAGGKEGVKGVKVGEWNKMEIVVKGGSIDFIINGVIHYNEPGVFISFEETEDELYKDVASLHLDLQGHLVVRCMVSEGRRRLVSRLLRISDELLLGRDGARLARQAGGRVGRDGVERREQC